METMSPEMRQSYAELSDTNLKLQEVINRMQEELDTIAKDKTLLQQQLYNNSVDEIFILYQLSIIS